MTWSKRMNLAIEYIENNLDGVLSVEDVAKQACCSVYHFHRMFFAHCSITCAEYIRKRKLTLAAADVVHSDKSVLDIALKYGYESPNAFTRAFRNMHGINPSTARAGAAKLSSYNRIFFPVKNNGGESMHYRITEIPQFNIIGKSKRFTFDRFVKEGSKFWKEYVATEDYKKLYRLNEGRPGPITNAPLLSAYFPKESEKQGEFIDVLGIEAVTEAESTGFDVYTVPSATYAEFACTYKTSMKTNRYVYGEWFPSTGYERDGNKPDIVAYFPIPFRPMSEMYVRWWMPVIGKQM